MRSFILLNHGTAIDSVLKTSEKIIVVYLIRKAHPHFDKAIRELRKYSNLAEGVVILIWNVDTNDSEIIPSSATYPSLFVYRQEKLISHIQSTNLSQLKKVIDTLQEREQKEQEASNTVLELPSGIKIPKEYVAFTFNLYRELINAGKLETTHPIRYEEETDDSSTVVLNDGTIIKPLPDGRFGLIEPNEKN